EINLNEFPDVLIDVAARPTLTEQKVHEMQIIIDNYKSKDPNNVDVADANQIYNTQCYGCITGLVETINYPCKHVGLCRNCSKNHELNNCIICGAQVEKYEIIHLPRNNEADGYNLQCEICYTLPINIMWQPCNQGHSCERCAVLSLSLIKNRDDGSTVWENLTTDTNVKCPHCNSNSEGFIEFILSRRNDL
ncbi:hypothetical protein KQX54_000588, partial [Cotesia glomerata]